MKKHFEKLTKVGHHVMVSVRCTEELWPDCDSPSGVIMVVMNSDDAWTDAHLIAKKMKLKQTKAGKKQEKVDKKRGKKIFSSPSSKPER